MGSKKGPVSAYGRSPESAQGFEVSGQGNGRRSVDPVDQSKMRDHDAHRGTPHTRHARGGGDGFGHH